MNRLISLASLATAALIALAAPLAARAADTPALTGGNAPAAATDKLAAARAAIAQKNWAGAIAALKQVNDTGSADWNNLMGYSHRKGATPDLPAAERYYNEALRIDPKHRGALEYSGELYLMQGDLAKAEGRLAALDKACFLPCDEFKDLKEAIARFKANGNKHVAKEGW